MITTKRKYEDLYEFSYKMRKRAESVRYPGRRICRGRIIRRQITVCNGDGGRFPAMKDRPPSLCGD